MHEYLIDEVQGRPIPVIEAADMFPNADQVPRIASWSGNGNIIQASLRLNSNDYIEPLTVGFRPIKESLDQFNPSGRVVAKLTLSLYNHDNY